MRIAVCDDCMEDTLSLKKCLAGHEVSAYSSADDLLTDMEKKKMQYDLYLLDIFMEESMNGIELAEKLRKIQEEELKKFLLRVQKNLARDNEKKLVYSRWGKNGAIPYGKIRYISSRGHTISICCTDGNIQESTGKLTDLEHQVCGEIFMRCHQSFIVNMYHVEGMAAGLNYLILLFEKRKRAERSRMNGSR